MAITSSDVSTNKAMSPRNSAPICNSSLSCFPDGERAYQVVQSFPKHDTIKLKKDNSFQWQHQLRLIIDGYGLIGYVHGTLPTPSWLCQIKKES
ncbi:hypothetical protein PVK06_008266 [Gossypium arboreum]|uniref:Uncharacterized protein n=1 Tax=Gossypium arboreum TaxID=29729 RepID=A0ABR0QJI8_GOSAR|nr:hypothetical protein PVK06_008266 [Gossypium arboreum]